MTPRRLVIAVSSALAAALVLAGCTVGPGGTAPHTTSDPSSGPGNAGSSDEQDDMDATLLDDGRMFAVVSWGSSTCLPRVDEITAEGQRVSVTLVEPEGDGATEQACTADLAPRASVGALPEGVDPTKDITLVVTYGDLLDEIDVDADPEATATPGSATEYQPSAGWFDDGGLVLLTWGSSSCAPVVESAEADGSTGTVTFVTDENQVCTMDMAPRATVVEFPEDDVDDDGPFQLTLVGGGLDGTVEVR
ncbi:conserved exported protein of unknown function [Microbacterium sp. Nx66]|uniref:hypothetical protein n=1 Tax=Microbacterium sp. Nx66 TaxID=2766784 RepID=UPI0016574225|nr:hypothetical protein [Microbacterium sp. Nx66]CAD5138094.1 conserved exported protein of unknown function [Microbacterium sp. Nx66]